MHTQETAILSQVLICPIEWKECIGKLIDLTSLASTLTALAGTHSTPAEQWSTDNYKTLVVIRVYNI